MSDKQSNNKRIAKNTITLYIRMFFTMAVSLYTSRLVLQALGIEDYGVYNVVGGVVSMLGVVNSSLMGASSRFITYSQGTGDSFQIQRNFNCIVTIHYVFAFLILFLAETIGLWFVLNKLIVPDGRLTATLWVYQCAVITSVLQFISVPYNSLVIAHEKMSAFAYISVFECCIHLLIASMLFVISYDRLISYALLIVCIKIVVILLYTIYCKKKFKESHYHLCWDKEKMKEMFVYTGWILNGNLAFLGYTQGISIILNLFFGPIVNAARGISQQVQAAIYSFTNNFQIAINPQITKSYSKGDFNRMHQLVLISSRLGFYLMTLIVLPLYANIDYILNFWLSDVPDYSGSFVRIMLIVGLNSTLRNPTMTAIQATGDVKKIQIWEGSILLTILPLAYILLKFYNISPIQVILVYMCIELFVQFVRVFITYPRIGLDLSLYFTKILLPCFKVLCISSILCYIWSFFYTVDSIMSLLCYAVFSSIIILITVWCLGLGNSERAFIRKKINQLFTDKYKSSNNAK